MKKKELMQQIINRADELGLDYKDVAARCGVNLTTVYRNFSGDKTSSADTILKYVSGLNFKITIG